MHRQRACIKLSCIHIYVIVPTIRLPVADDGSDISVSGGNFSGGSSTRGGFLFADFNTRVTISGGVIEDNVATINGGAIYCNGDEASNVSIEGGTFRHNKALESGGAIALWGATTLVSITGGTFEDNEAT